MKLQFRHSAVFTAAAVVASFVLAAPLHAQDTPVQKPAVAAATHASASTPRTPDGKPDLTGMWRPTGARQGRSGTTPFVGAFVGSPEAADGTEITKEDNGDFVRLVTSRRCAPNQKGTDGTGCQLQTNQNIDYEQIDRLDANRPLYRPEFWDKVQDLDYNTNFKDPVFTCQPLGVPRMGPPAEIMQKGDYAAFFYAGYPSNESRVIPIDGRGHAPDAAQNITFFGDSVGHWEGETLVVDSIGFTDFTWLSGGLEGGGGGYFHSYDMHVIETFRRDGNTLYYQATVDDPTVLLKPWVMNARTLGLNPDPKAFIHETDPCGQVDPDRVVLKIRH